INDWKVTLSMSDDMTVTEYWNCEFEKNTVVPVSYNSALPAKETGKKTVWTINGKDYEVAAHNVNACTVAALGMRNEFAGIEKRGDLVEGKNPTDEDIAKAMKAYKTSDTNLDHYPKNYCNKCQIYCPIGNRDKIFKETGLSKL
ncbi:MAG: hypothetical protein MJ150_02210, partial [Clostridia bacterium]|nr:hypothetical protein [Clostridia bacterium]